MPSNNKISLPVIKRLPRYYRYVESLLRQGVATVSSSELARMLGTTASQVRQDFNCFGGFGQQGVGYNVQLLAGELENLLYHGDKLQTVLIGTGRLGRTISGFIAREVAGFELVAAFDNAPGQIGQPLGELTVQDVDTLERYCRRHHPQVAVLCVPEAAAAELAPLLAGLDFKGLWNFSHHDVGNSNPAIAVENVHLGDSLAGLGFRVRNPAGEDPHD